MTVHNHTTSKKDPEFNITTQRVLILLSLSALFISFMNAINTSIAPGFDGLINVLIVLICIPVCAILSLFGLITTFETAKVVKQHQKSHRVTTTQAKGYVIFYISVILLQLASVAIALL